jgi:hypothetical protein
MTLSVDGLLRVWRSKDLEGLGSLQKHLSAADQLLLGVSQAALIQEKSGWIVKQGAQRKSWKKRWFQLTPEGRLFYSETADVCCSSVPTLLS